MHCIILLLICKITSQIENTFTCEIFKSLQNYPKSFLSFRFEIDIIRDIKVPASSYHDTKFSKQNSNDAIP